MFHPVTFEMKQAHFAAVRLIGRDTLPFGVTPARFNMIRAIFCGGGCVRQSWLRKFLCVSAPVISIMVRALEKLGLVCRMRSIVDQRTFAVSLTMKAKAILREVFYSTNTMGYHELALVSAFTKNHMPVPGWEVAVTRLEKRLNAFRRAFGRGSHETNPWHPVDDADAYFFHAAVKNNPNRINLVPFPCELKYDGTPLDAEYDDVKDPYPSSSTFEPPRGTRGGVYD